MADLRRSLERGELSLVFQPKLDVSGSQVRHAEALLRWTHPEHGPIPPDEFIPLAERSGFVTEAAAQNIPMPETMALTGHRSPASVIGYFRQGEVLGLRAARLMEEDNAEPTEPKKRR